MKSVCEIDVFGNKYWYKEGAYIYHREDGPAVMWGSGHKEWWVNGERHREDGPAIEYADGTVATVEQMAADVTEFLAWSSDPKLEQRKQAGFATMLYLLILSVLMWFSYKRVWRNVKH